MLNFKLGYFGSEAAMPLSTVTTLLFLSFLLKIRQLISLICLSFCSKLWHSLRVTPYPAVFFSHLLNMTLVFFIHLQLCCPQPAGHTTMTPPFGQKPDSQWTELIWEQCLWALLASRWLRVVVVLGLLAKSSTASLSHVAITSIIHDPLWSGAKTLTHFTCAKIKHVSFTLNR